MARTVIAFPLETPPDAFRGDETARAFGWTDKWDGTEPCENDRLVEEMANLILRYGTKLSGPETVNLHPEGGNGDALFLFDGRTYYLATGPGIVASMRDLAYLALKIGAEWVRFGA